jgi:hypothetical protein
MDYWFVYEAKYALSIVIPNGGYFGKKNKPISQEKTNHSLMDIFLTFTDKAHFELFC